jgi:S1-C subfamily serine protease
MNLNVTQGAFLTDVVAGGAAEKAGLQRGDVVVRAGSKTVTRMNELLEVVGAKRPGDKLTVTVLRDGTSQTVTLTLKDRPADLGK